MLIIVGCMGFFVLLTYILVIGNITHSFDLENPDSYFKSPWWVGITQENAIMITVFQGIAAISLVYWIWWVYSHNFKEGPFCNQNIKNIVVYTFLLASLLWPFLAYPALKEYPKKTSTEKAILACIPLWISAIAMICGLAFTFESRAPILPTLSIVMASIVVVLFDGIGWSASLIYHNK